MLAKIKLIHIKNIHNSTTYILRVQKQMKPWSSALLKNILFKSYSQGLLLLIWI